MHSNRMCTARSSSRLWGGSTSVHVGIPPLGVGLETPPGCGPGHPPGVGLDTPPGQTPQLPPWVWAWRPARHAGNTPPDTCKVCWKYHLQCMLRYHPPPPPRTEFLTYPSENITLPQTSFPGGKNIDHSLFAITISQMSPMLGLINYRSWRCTDITSAACSSFSQNANSSKRIEAYKSFNEDFPITACATS